MNNSPNKAVIAIIVVVLLAGAGAGAYFLGQRQDTTTTSQNESASTTDISTNPTTTPSTDSGTTATTGSYADGTYEATGNYTSPGGSEEVKVSLTLANGVITSSTVTTVPSDPTARQYQTQFINGYKSLVDGKSIDSVQLDVVSGSSLTSAGFNDALETIKNDARA